MKESEIALSWALKKGWIKLENIDEEVYVIPTGKTWYLPKEVEVASGLDRYLEYLKTLDFSEYKMKLKELIGEIENGNNRM